MRPAGVLMLNAGVDLLPDWAQAMLGFERYAPLRRAFARPGVQAGRAGHSLGAGERGIETRRAAAAVATQ